MSPPKSFSFSFSYSFSFLLMGRGSRDFVGPDLASGRAGLTGRENEAASRPPSRTRGSTQGRALQNGGASAANTAATPANTGNLWLRAHAQRLNLDSAVTGRSYKQFLYGLDLGADRIWPLAPGATLHTGLYLGHARAEADYKTPGIEAELTSTHGGLYATLIRDNGLHADAVLKIASVDNTLETLQGATSYHTGYKNLNLGASVELGWRSPLQNNWYIEPALQFSYLHIFAKDYTAGPMRIAAADMDALQARFTHTLGRTLRLANGGILQPHARLGGATLTSSGGEIRNGYQHLRPALDGARFELGAGLDWQLSAAHQFHFDCEASYAEKYNKPWGLTAGYRFQF
jgi:outer membrane autotransporter protein